jgi:polar amino acid transport system substrate-binding protein
MKTTSRLVGMFCGLLLFCFVGCNKNVHNNNDNNAYDRILKSGEIKVAYISYPPGFIKDPNTGDFSGIMNDVFCEVAKNMDVKVVYQEEVTWATLVETVETGKVDIVISPVWPTAQRGKYADFTIPVYLGSLKAYCRVDDDRFDGNIDRINSSDITISTIDGEISTNVAVEDFPKAKITGLPNTTDISQMLLNVESKKADIAFVEPFVAGNFMSANPNVIREVKGIKPLRIYPNEMMIKKGEYKLQSMINIAIQELINNGYVDKVITKYEPIKGSFYKTASQYQED